MFDIKNQKLNPKSKYTQGAFDKYNPRKYIGKRPIIYRSSYEKKFMLKMEINEKVAEWSSETIVIPYYVTEYQNGKSVRKRHNYFIDFVVKLKSGEKYIIEVKPNSLVPKCINDITRSHEMKRNACKWKAAIQWAKDHGYIFKIVTENHLNGTIF